MKFNADRIPVVEAYLRESFPDAEIERLYRTSDPFRLHEKPHEHDAEMWRAETPTHFFDLGISDEFMEDHNPENLASSLRSLKIAGQLMDCPNRHRLWIMRGYITTAPLGEAPF